MFEDETEEELSFFQRHRVIIFIGALILAGAAAFIAAVVLTKGNHTVAVRDDVMAIQLPPTPPPPPPKPLPTPPPLPPPPEQQQEQKMIEQQPVQDEKKPDAPKDKPPDAPAPLGTSITGPGGGPDLGLGRGLGGGGGYGSGVGGGSKYGWYASEVQNRIRDALVSDPHTRKASLSVVARIWLDPTGRITKAQVSGGDPTLDAAVEQYVLTGLQMADGPPGDMPLPVVMRIALKRPR